MIIPHLGGEQNPAYIRTEYYCEDSEDFFFGVFRNFLGRLTVNIVPFFSVLENERDPPILFITMRDI